MMKQVDISQWSGKLVRLAISLKNTQLYSFCFADSDEWPFSKILL